MTSIWTSGEDGWSLMAPSGFPDEATLHSLVEDAPELLPLAGEPRLVVLGREVPIGGGSADLIAVEPSGRVVVIEVKLARNAEARRAVVAQVLGYAAFLRGTELAQLENVILRSNLLKRGHKNIGAAVEEADQEGSFDRATFEAAVAESLGSGRFRLILVLDDAPPELVRIVGYLESIAPELVIDLITVASYDVSGQRVLVPRRVEPGEVGNAPSPARSLGGTPKPAPPTKQGHLIDIDEYEAGIDNTAEGARPMLRRMLAWGKALDEEGVLRLLAFRGANGRSNLLPYLPNDDAGLITVWSDGTVSLWRTVFERRAPASIATVERLIAPKTLGHGKTVNEMSDALLVAITDAYKRASL